MGRGDDEPEVLGEKRHRRGRQDAGQNGRSTRRGDPACERLLERGPRGARVPADERPAAAGPQRDGAAEALHQLGRQRLADHAAHAVGAEPPALSGCAGNR